MTSTAKRIIGAHYVFLGLAACHNIPVKVQTVQTLANIEWLEACGTITLALRLH